MQYALAEYRLLEMPPHPEQIKRIRRALNEGESRPGVADRLRAYHRALAYALDEAEEGRKPTLDILYRAGLGDLAVTLVSSARRPDPVELIAAEAQRLIARTAVAAARSG